jgi:hypothetical protein
MRVSTLLALAAVIVLVSGCTASKPNAGSQTPASGGSSAGQHAKPEVLEDKGTMTASAGVAITFTVGAMGVQPTATGNVTLMYFELKWDGPTDLNLCVHKPTSGSTGTAENCDGAVANKGLPGMPDSPVHATYPNPEPGAWSASPYATGASGNTNYALAVTLFHGETEVPAGYTALT